MFLRLFARTIRNLIKISRDNFFWGERGGKQEKQINVHKKCGGGINKNKVGAGPPLYATAMKEEWVSGWEEDSIVPVGKDVPII